MATYQKKFAERVIEEVAQDRKRIDRYRKYWKQLVPQNADEYYRRFLFAIASVRTGWEETVTTYLGLAELLDNNGGFIPCMGTIKPKEPIPNDELWLELKTSRGGLYNNRYVSIAKFSYGFRASPEYWYPVKGESLFDTRNRIRAMTFGLGLAKSAFALEMCYPETNEVTCLDTHMLKLYRCSASNISDSIYFKIEKHWCATCQKHNVPSVIARHIYWDNIQDRPDTRYWSFVFETDYGRIASAA